MIKPGQYWYRPHRSMWGVWRQEETVNGVGSAEFIDDFPTRKEAEAFVYEKNGWRK